MGTNEADECQCVVQWSNFFNPSPPSEVFFFWVWSGGPSITGAADFIKKINCEENLLLGFLCRRGIFCASSRRIFIPAPLGRHERGVSGHFRPPDRTQAHARTPNPRWQGRPQARDSVGPAANDVHLRVGFGRSRAAASSHLHGATAAHAPPRRDKPTCMSTGPLPPWLPRASFSEP